MTDYAGNYVTFGPPGCGKTHWLAVQVERLLEKGQRVLLCSLTRTAAAEIAERARAHNLPIERNRIGTLHAHAYRALGMPKIAEEFVDEFGKAHPSFTIQGSAFDTDDPYAGASIRASSGATLYEDYQTLRARMVPIESWPSSVVGFAKAWEAWKTDAGLFDFTDLIESAMKLLPPVDVDVIVADEAQDLSALEYALLRSWAESAKALIVVGDPDQALYTWRGASSELFLDPTIGKDRRHYLRRSYRLPSSVVAAARQFSERWMESYSRPTIEPRTEDGQPVAGLVSLVDTSLEDPVSVVQYIERSLAGDRSVMVAASCSFMLQRIVAEMKRLGVPFGNPWRTRRADWNPLTSGQGKLAAKLSRFLRMTEGGMRSWRVVDVWEWASLLSSSKALVRGAKKAFEAASDRDMMGVHDLDKWFRLESLSFVTAAFGGVSTGTARDWLLGNVLKKHAQRIEYMMRVALAHGTEALSGRPRVFIGTIHSFKGAEADDVILSPDMSMSAAEAWHERGERHDSVARTFYVGMTRARQNLYVCQASQFARSVSLV